MVSWHCSSLEGRQFRALSLGQVGETYNHFYCQVKNIVSGSGKRLTLVSRWKKKKTVLLRGTHAAFLLLKRDAAPATGAAKAYHESQSRIFKTEAPLFVGVGEGTDNLDFLADLSALKVIDPDEVNQAIPPGEQPVPKSNSRLLEMLKHEDLPYAHCAWCPETPKTRSMLEEHYYEIHNIVLQPSCCAPPSVFQTIMGKELRLRQGNFGSYSTNRVFLRDKMRYDEAKEILGSCAVQEDKAKVWYVKMPEFFQLGDTSLVSPELHILDEDESDLNEYMLDPTDPVVCVPDQDDPEYWSLLRSAHESKFGGPGSTMNFWELSAHSERPTLGVKMPSTAAFLSMPHKDGIILGGKTIRGFNENTMQGYPLWLPLTTLQVTDAVMRDEDILGAKGGRHVSDNSQAISDPEEIEKQ